MTQNDTANRPPRFLPPTPAQIGTAAALAYFDLLSDEQIAAACGVCRRTLARWKKRPEYRAAARAAREVGDVSWRQQQAALHRQRQELIARFSAPKQRQRRR